MVDMLTAARRAVARLGQTALEEFESDTDLQWIMFSQIVLIGEAAARMPSDARNLFPEVPWSQAVSMRNRVVHGYDSIDWKIVYETVSGELPNLIAILESKLGPGLEVDLG